MIHLLLIYRSIYFVEINIFNIQLQIFPVSPAHYTPTFSAHECTQYTEEYSKHDNCSKGILMENSIKYKVP